MGDVKCASPKKRWARRVRRVSVCSEVEGAILELGFSCAEKGRWLRQSEKDPGMLKSIPRFTYRMGSWRVLSPSDDCPWWTVQHRRGEDVEFVDFPLTVDPRRLVAYLTA